MKRLLWLLAPLVLGGAVAKSDGFRLRDDVRGELRIGGRGVLPRAASTASSYSFCDTALVAGNRTGTWGCINGDGTAPTGDNLGPWSQVGSPTTTTGTTCTAPSYLTFDASPDYVQSTTAVGTTPAAFTICSLWKQQAGTGLLQTGWMWGVYPCCSSFVSLAEESSVFIGYYPSSVSSFVSVAANDKALVCGSYSGGTAHTYVRTLGGILAYTNGAASPPSVAGAKFIFGSDGTYTNTGQFFGAFYTEKELSQGDLDAIFDAVVGSGCT